MKSGKITVLGLCGRSGSGKGYVCGVFATLGVPSVDTDKVYAEIVANADSPCVAELRREFSDVIISDGKLNKKALAQIVFSDKSKLESLNQITHKYIRKQTQNLIDEYEKNGVKILIIDAPVLFESGFNSLCDYCVCVTCDEELCIERIMQRDNTDESAAKRRLSSQISAEELRHLCDFEIVNDGNVGISEQARAIIETVGEKE